MKLLKLGDEWEIISSGEISSVWSKWKCRGEGLKKRISSLVRFLYVL